MIERTRISPARTTEPVLNANPTTAVVPLAPVTASTDIPDPPLFGDTSRMPCVPFRPNDPIDPPTPPGLAAGVANVQPLYSAVAVS
jgi:hypothetical protein